MVYLVANYSIEGIQNATIEDVFAYCQDKEVLGLDIETCEVESGGKSVYKGGLDPYLSGVVMLQIGDLAKRFVIDTRVVSIEPLLPILNSPKLFVGANLKFEQKHLFKHGVILTNIHDVMLVEMNLYNGIKQSYSLEAISSRYFQVKRKDDITLFNVEDWEDLDAYIIDKSTRMQFIRIGDRPFTTAQVLYGADDIELPLRIREVQLKGREVNGEIYNPQTLHKLENKTALALAIVELNGIPFDVPKLLELDKVNRATQARRRDILERYVVENHPEFAEPSLFGGGICKIKWSSPKQVIPLFDKLGICPEERSKSTGKISKTVGAKALEKIMDQSHKRMFERGVEKEIETKEDLIVQYLLYKEAEQLVKTFGKEYLKYIHPKTGKAHPNFFQILNTGRLSSSNPNMMQWPGTKEYRSVVATKKGHFITCDYSSQEIRILAQVSGVLAMRDFFRKGNEVFGDDFHSFTATRVERLRRNDPEYICPPKEISGNDNPEFTAEHGQQRSRAKTTNFAINYGAGPPNLAGQFGSTIEEAEEFIDNYIDSWTGLRENFAERKRFVIENGYIVIDPITDRRWFAQDFDKMNELYEQAWAFYPHNYRNLSKEERLEVKERLYSDHPELPRIWKEYMGLKGSLERKSLNYPIQGTGGSQTKYALVKLHKLIVQNNWFNDFQIVNLVHDELNAIAYRDPEAFAKLLSKTMEEAAEAFCKDVPFKAEYKIDKTWKK